MKGLDKVSRVIYKEFQKKFLLGKLAVIQAAAVASLQVTNQKPFSIIVVASSGAMKSSIMDDMQRIFHDYTYQITSRFTPYGMSNLPDKHALDGRTWLINDMVRTFDTLSFVKIQELVGWLAELLSEGVTGSLTAKEAFLEARMNMIGNIARIKYKDVKRYFVSSTFAERILQYQYSVDIQDIRTKTKPEYVIDIEMPKLDKAVVEIPRKYRQIVYDLADKLKDLQSYEKESMRPDSIVKSILCGHALLNGRKKVNPKDIYFLKLCYPNLKRVI